MQPIHLSHGASTLPLADFGGSGPTVLLVHGLGGSHANFVTFAGMLRQHARVLALDLPGFGLSPPGAGSTVPAFVDAVRRVLDAIGNDEIPGATLPACLVGNSLGGAVAILVASKDRGQLRRLCLVCPAVPQPDPSVLDPRFAFFFGATLLPGHGALFGWRLRHAGPAAVVHEMLALTCAEKRRVARADIDAMIAIAERRMDFAWSGDAFTQAARSLVATLLRRGPFEQAMRAIRIPVLLVQGDRDRLVPVASARRAAVTAPHFVLDVLEGVGHVPQLETPRMLADKLIAFFELGTPRS